MIPILVSDAVPSCGSDLRTMGCEAGAVGADAEEAGAAVDAEKEASAASISADVVKNDAGSLLRRCLTAAISDVTATSAPAAAAACSSRNFSTIFVIRMSDVMERVVLHSEAMFGGTPVG